MSANYLFQNWFLHIRFQTGGRDRSVKTSGPLQLDHFQRPQIRCLNQGPYSQHFFFFVTHQSAQQARVLHYTTLEGLLVTSTLAYWVHL
jgi:hypothetical protein